MYPVINRKPEKKYLPQKPIQIIYKIKMHGFPIVKHETPEYLPQDAKTSIPTINIYYIAGLHNQCM